MKFKLKVLVLLILTESMQEQTISIKTGDQIFFRAEVLIISRH